MSDAAAPACTIRPLDRAADGEIALVARRMHLTLAEVLGEERARAMYDDAWLRARVRWHLDGADGLGGEVLLALVGGAIAGHTIVRVEPVDGGHVGLFSTTYVDPAARRRGVAQALLAAGEDWLRARGMQQARTYTDVSNVSLQELYGARGYVLTRLEGDWVQLAREL